MASIDHRTISLPEEQAGYIDRLVESGRYATSSDVVRAGLRDLQDQDGAMESWLRDEVVPVAAAMMADPTRGLPAADVFDEIRRRHESRVKMEKRGA